MLCLLCHHAVSVDVRILIVLRTLQWDKLLHPQSVASLQFLCSSLLWPYLLVFFMLWTNCRHCGKLISEGQSITASTPTVSELLLIPVSVDSPSLKLELDL